MKTKYLTENLRTTQVESTAKGGFSREVKC